MKKIFTFIILICIFFIPSVVDAKIRYEVNWRKDGETLVYEKDNKYYTVKNLDYIYALSRFYENFDVLYFNVYDKNGKFLNKEKVYDDDETILSDFMKTDHYNFLMGYFDNHYNYFYDKKNKISL